MSRQIKTPDILIEPTCGKGSFILAALKSFTTLQSVYGIEIYKPYVWEAKFSILDFFLKNPSANNPDITISHYNVFDFDFDQIAIQSSGKNILIVGNPPELQKLKHGLRHPVFLPNPLLAVHPSSHRIKSMSQIY